MNNDDNSIKVNPYSNLKTMFEGEMFKNNLIKEENVPSITVKRAYCEECGEELISAIPPMFNPYTLERICKHTCKKCGKEYNLEYAYPRLVIKDNNGNEIPAYIR